MLQALYCSENKHWGVLFTLPLILTLWLSLCGRDWSSLFVVDLGLSLKGLQNHLQKLILKHKKPEYSVRYKSLLTDLALHHQQLEDNEVCGVKIAPNFVFDAEFHRTEDFIY